MGLDGIGHHRSIGHRSPKSTVDVNNRIIMMIMMLIIMIMMPSEYYECEAPGKAS